MRERNLIWNLHAPAFDVEINQKIIERAPADQGWRVVRRCYDNPRRINLNCLAADRHSGGHRPVGYVVIPVVGIVEAVWVGRIVNRCAGWRSRFASSP